MSIKAARIIHSRSGHIAAVAYDESAKPEALAEIRQRCPAGSVIVLIHTAKQRAEAYAIRPDGTTPRLDYVSKILGAAMARTVYDGPGPNGIQFAYEIERDAIRAVAAEAHGSPEAWTIQEIHT